MKALRFDGMGPDPLLSFFCVAIFALVASWWLYGLLDSSGVLKNEAFEIGGAAAGFVLFFLVGHRVLSSMIDGWERRTGLALQNKSLEQRVRQLETPEIPKIERPEGFIRFASRDYGIGFSRPQSWSPHTEIFLGIFMRPIDEEVKRLRFQGNVAISTSPYSLATQIEHPLLVGSKEDKLLKAPHLRTILGFKVEPEDVAWDNAYIQN